MNTERDPHVVFVNLGDMDRFARCDTTGPSGLEAGRRTALADNDRLVCGFPGPPRADRGLGAVDRRRPRRPLDALLGPDRAISLSDPADPVLRRAGPVGRVRRPQPAVAGASGNSAGRERHLGGQEAVLERRERAWRTRAGSVVGHIGGRLAFRKDP